MDKHQFALRRFLILGLALNAIGWISLEFQWPHFLELILKCLHSPIGEGVSEVVRPFLFLVLISIVPVTLIGVLATRKRLSSQRKSFRWLENLKLPSAVFGGFACVGSLILWWILSADALKVLVAFQVVGQYRDEITVLGKIQAASHDIVQNAFLSFGLGCLLGWLSIELLAVGREGDSSE